MLNSKARLPYMILLAAASLLLLAYAAFAGTGADPGGSDDPLVTQSYVDMYTQWQVGDLKAGQVFKGHAGTELIVRRGQSVVMDSTTNGIPDLTAGVDLRAGDVVPLNHLLLIPKKDGRGVRALSPLVIMYRGGADIR